MNNSKPENLTKLERLSVLLHDDGVDPEMMNPAQTAQYLKDHEVDVISAQKRFAAVLKKAKARQALESARERRLRAIEKAHSVLSAGVEAADNIREKVRQMIESLGQKDPEHAQVYAREFEKATPEDLAVLEEDLTLLEMEATEDGKRDSKNPG
ncbi:MAG TPA: hypothetical protein VNN22_19415 [Verrucomicrobiae bacterium]|nr:hypothetical protein [Verrucomicrobiae bacterium]